MTRYRDPSAPSGRVVFGGVEFVDGVTADITPGPDTLELFRSAGIFEATSEPAESDVSAAEDPNEAPTGPQKPARKK